MRRHQLATYLMPVAYFVVVVVLAVGFLIIAARAAYHEAWNWYWDSI